jgi:peptide/nickel transport system permease protein
MEDTNTVNKGFQEIAPSVSETRRFMRVFFGRKVVIIGSVIILILILTAIFAPLLAPYDPYLVDTNASLLNASRAHLLGTDSIGRDTLSRLIYGSRTSLLVGLISVSIAAILGITLGLIAGYFGGITYTLIMRGIDTLMALPVILLALVITAALGDGIYNLMIALGISISPVYARVMCAECLSIKQNEYILAARSIGVKPVDVMLRHILPNGFAPILVMMTMQLGFAILAESSLSFLGLGVTPPQAAWGAMVSAGYPYLKSNPLLSFAPGVAIILVVFAFNMVGDGLRDTLDPRLRGNL